MAQKIEKIRGGGGSIRVGSHGTISSLMKKELESSSSSPNIPSSSTRSPRSTLVSVNCNDSTLKLRRSTDEAQCSGTSSSMKHKSLENVRLTRGQNQHRVIVLGSTTPKRQKEKVLPEEASGGRDGSIRRSPEFPWKTRIHKRMHRIPMLGAENVALDKTPKREKPARKVSIVEVVDTKCGVPAGSLSSRLKKLGFSKLSQSII